jgi:L-threonylcarbamoyladenylate synthase
MKTIEIAPEQLSSVANEVADYLSAGSVVALPTDTIYGLSALMSKPRALNRIAQMKGRAADKPFLLLVNGWEMASKVAEIEGRQEALAEWWPGPRTVILPAKVQAPQLVSATGGIALRWPANPWLQQLLDRLGEPLVSTSLNRGGEANLSRPLNLADYFAGLEPDLVVDIGELNGQPSTLVDWLDITDPKQLR